MEESLAGQPAGLPGGADAVAQDQPHVEDVAQQPLGQAGHPRRRAAAVQDHQVHVAVGGHVATAVTAVGHQGDFIEQPVGAGFAQVRQRSVDQFQQHGVAEIGRQARRPRRRSSPPDGDA